jgi:DNA-binding transcriptional ArsR family regulator
MTPVDLSLDALGSPTRRALLDAIGHHGTATVGHLALGLPVSRPAVSQQLRVLERAGLVDFDAVGRERRYRLRATGFDAARGYLDTLWPLALDRFAALAESSWQPPESR